MRINFYGPPGCGKSTLAAWLFSEMKRKGYAIEHVTEYIKKWAYMKRQPKGYEALYVFSKQIHAEDVFLRHGIDHIVTDSPIMLNCAYTAIYNHPIHKDLLEISKKWDLEYPSLNIWLDKDNWPYQATGRYESAEESIERESQLRNWITNESGICLKVFSATDRESILKFVEEKLKND